MGGSPRWAAVHRAAWACPGQAHTSPPASKAAPSTARPPRMATGFPLAPYTALKVILIYLRLFAAMKEGKYIPKSNRVNYGGVKEAAP